MANPSTATFSPSTRQQNGSDLNNTKDNDDGGGGDDATWHDAIRVEGHLLKLGQRARKRWNDRYFVLADNELSYYDGQKKKKNTKPKDTFSISLGTCTISSLFMDQRQQQGNNSSSKELLYCFRITLFDHPTEIVADDGSLIVPAVPQSPVQQLPRSGITMSPLHQTGGSLLLSAPNSFEFDDIPNMAPQQEMPPPQQQQQSTKKKRSIFRRSKSGSDLGDDKSLERGAPATKGNSSLRSDLSLDMTDEGEQARRLLMPRLRSLEATGTGYIGTPAADDQRSYLEQQQWHEQQLMHTHYISERKEHKKRTRKRIKEGGKLAVAAGAAVTVGVLTAGVGIIAGLAFLGAGAAAGGTGVVGGAAYRQRRKDRGELVLASPHYEEARRWKAALDACLVSETVVRDSTWGQLFVMDGRSAKTALLPTDIGGIEDGASPRGAAGPTFHFDDKGAANFVGSGARWEPVQEGGWSTLLGTGTQGMRVFREERSSSKHGRLSVNDHACPPLKTQSVLTASPLQAFLCTMSLARVPPNKRNNDVLRPNSGQCASFRIIERMDDHTDVIHLFFRPLYLFPSWTAPRDFVLYRYWRYEADGSYIICFDSVKHADCPPHPDYTRGDMHGVYTIAPQKKRHGDFDQRSLLTSVVQVEPRGWVPRTFISTYAEAFGVAVLLQMLDIKDALDHERFLPVPLDATAPTARRIESNDKSQIIEDDPSNYDFSYSRHESQSRSRASIGCQPPPLPRDMWAEPDANSFRVRGKTYKKDKIKINAGSPIARLIAVDVVRVDEPIHAGFAMHPKERIQLGLEREKQLLAKGLESDMPAFVFLVNIILPGPPLYHGVYYFAVDDMSSIDGTDGTPSSKLCQKFFFGDSDDFRDKTFKLVPTIVEGNFVVKRGVGSSPAIMGTKLSQHYVKSDRFFEVILDCGSSSVATGVIRLSLGYAKTLVVDMGFLFEGNDETTLPERIFGCVRMKYPEFGNALRKVSPYSTEDEERTSTKELESPS